jgi:hypothetical protein
MRFLILLLIAVLAVPSHAQEAPPAQNPPIQLKMTLETSAPLSELMARAREALKNEADPNIAVEALNEVLLSENEYNREAYELIITAFERAGKPNRAKAVIKLYLSLYPDVDVAKRVRERLLAIEIANPDTVKSIAIQRGPKEGTEKKLEGSASEYLYVSSTTPKPLSLKMEQITLISNLRTTGFYRDGQYETKVVVRESKLQNFAGSNSSRSSTQIANVEFKDTFRQYQLRVGRQNPTFGAVNRFDGVMAKVDPIDGLTLGLNFGAPYTVGSTSKRQFFGGGFETSFTPSVSTSSYFNVQSNDGLRERSAFGSDLRWYNGNASGLAALEYDSTYKSLNSMLLQYYGTFREYTLYALLDRRKSPLLMSDRALFMGYSSPIHTAYSSIAELTGQYSSSQIYSFVAGTTPMASTMVLSVGKKLSDRWDITQDVQVTNLSATNDSTFVPSLEVPTSVLQSPASGDRIGLNTQLYGQNIGNNSNSVNLILSLSKDKVSHSTMVTALDSERFKGFRVDFTGRVLTSTSYNVSRTEVLASVRTNYKVTERTSIEAQLSTSRSTVNDRRAGTMFTSYNKSMFVGIRVDL